MPRIYIGKYFEADFVEDFQKKTQFKKRCNLFFYC